MLGKLLYFININFGKYFFKNPNTLYHNIFNKLHLNLIANKKLYDEEIKQYVKKGFFKTNINSFNFSRDISLEIKKQTIDKNKSSVSFQINDVMKNKIKKHINEEFEILLKKLEKFYNSKISVANVEIRRNFYINENINKEVYSNYYHVDHYVYNHFKIFINLSDVNIDQGPLHIYSKDDTKKFMKFNNYKNRSNYINKELNKYLVTNTGKIGESFLANTTECLHKAGVVKKGNFRDMLFITFVTIPEPIDDDLKDFFYYEKKYPQSIWKYDKEVVKIAKPQSLRKTISLFLKYYKNKLN